MYFIGNNGPGTTTTGNNSRRQSNVLRCDNDSLSSLQGSLKRVVEYSPESSQRNQQNRTPLYLSGENSRTTLEKTESLTNNLYKMNDDSCSQQQLQQIDCTQNKKPFAMVRPRRILCTTNNEYRSFLSTLDLNYNMAARLRESKSLDLLPNQLRYRIDSKRIPVLSSRIREPSSCSLDAGVSLISQDPMPFTIDNLHNRYKSSRMLCSPDDDPSIALTEQNQKDKRDKHKILSKKPINNNCNGPADLAEDAQCPLLYRQNSFPQDEKLQQKRWRSLESVNLRGDASAPKKSVNRGSIRSWLVNLFQGNGFSDVSLRKVGVVQNRVKGFSNFGELSPAPEHESIV